MILSLNAVMVMTEIGSVILIERVIIQQTTLKVKLRDRLDNFLDEILSSLTP